MVMQYFDISSFRFFGKLRLMMSHLSTALRVRDNCLNSILLDGVSRACPPSCNHCNGLLSQLGIDFCKLTFEACQLVAYIPTCS